MADAGWVGDMQLAAAVHASYFMPGVERWPMAGGTQMAATEPTSNFKHRG